MLVKWSNIIVVKDAPIAIQIQDGDAWLIEPDDGEEAHFISAMRKIVDLGEDIDDENLYGWMRVPLEVFSEEEKNIIRELQELGLIKLEEGEVL